VRSTGEIMSNRLPSWPPYWLSFVRPGGGEEATQGNKGGCKRGKEGNQPKPTHTHLATMTIFQKFQPNKISDTDTRTLSTYPTRAKHISESQMQKMDSNRQKGEKCQDTSSRRIGLPNTRWTTPRKAIQKQKFAN
jgi:hypothetical protein